MKFYLSLLFVLFCFYLQAQKYHRVKVNLQHQNSNQLAQIGIAVDHGEYKKGIHFISDLSDDEIEKVKNKGFSYQILIQDIEQHYIQQNTSLKNYNPHQSTLNTSGCKTCPQFQTPANFNLGSMGGFFTYQEMLNILDSMAAKFPQLISQRQIIDTTHTINGNQLFWLKISDNPNSNETEPQILYTSLHHAREAESLSQLIFYMWYLLENYNTNDEIRYLIDNTEMYFIPCVNPDGYIYNETTNPNGGGMWRKNRRDNGDGSFGVDLNRNYGEHWGFDDNGSSPDPTSDTYRGTEGFSEVETKLVRDFCNAHQFKLALNNHTYSNLLIYPWGYIESFQTPDSLIFQNFAKRMTKCSGFSYGTGNETVGYLVNGVSDDWMYGEQQSKPMIFAMTPEAGNSSDGFWPAINRIVDIAKITMDQNITLARLAGKYAETENLQEKFITSTNEFVNYNFKRLGLENGTFTVSVIPITPNISTIGSTKTYMDPTHLQNVQDSISITLQNGLQQGELVKYILATNNGSYFHYDTITQIYGQPIIAFNNNCNSLSAFTNSGWGISSNQFVSAIGSVTDSPNGQYPNNTNEIITTTDFISLTDALAATLSFYAKWDIEKGYDFVELEISTDGTTFTPICGKYTVEGSEFQNNGLPLYDGRQLEWIKENIDLSDYLGQNIKLRYSIVSDGWVNGDGFYVDDIKVLKISNTVGLSQYNLQKDYLFYPNPAKDEITIVSGLLNQQKFCTIKLLDALGKVVLEKKSNEPSTQLLVNELPNGVYFLEITNENNRSFHSPLVILR
jgi:hypothetical protein